MAHVGIFSQPEKKLASLPCRQAEVASRQNFPNLQIDADSSGEGQFLTTLSFIEVELPNDSLVTLQLFDGSGQEVCRLLHEVFRSAGTHQVTFSAEKGGSVPRLYRLTVKSKGRVSVDVKRLWE